MALEENINLESVEKKSNDDKRDKAKYLLNKLRRIP